MRRSVLAAAVLLLAAGRIAVAASAATGGEPRILEHLYDVKMVSRSEGWAVGAFGTLARTSDGGATWRRQASPTEERLFGVDFADSKAGWAVGRAGTIVATKDGIGWQRQASGTENHLFKVRARSATEAWVIGDWSTVLRTTDGGASWKPVSLGDDPALRDIILNDIAFAGGEKAWIAGEAGTILVSLDGGKSWSRQETGTDKTLYGLHFVDVERGWAVGLDGVMIRTTDGGQQWTLLRGRGRIESLDEMGFLDVLKNPSLYSVDVMDDFGIAIGDLGMILVSTDGGATWNQQDVPGEWRLRWFRGISLVNGKHGAVVGAAGLVIPLAGGLLKYPEL